MSVYSYVSAFRGVFVKECIELKRYPLEYASTFVIMSIMFVAMFFFTKYSVMDIMGRYIGDMEAINRFNADINRNAGHHLVGFLVWILMMFSISESTHRITNEAQMGTLEQLYLSPLHPVILLIFHTFAMLCIIVVTIIGPTAIVIPFLTGIPFDINVSVAVSCLILVVVGMLGIGLMLGGIALIFKRITSLIQLVTWCVLLGAFAPLEGYNVLIMYFIRVFPPAQAMRIMRMSFIDKIQAVGSWYEYVWLLTGSLLLFAGGVAVYKMLERYALRNACLSHY